MVRENSAVLSAGVATAKDSVAAMAMQVFLLDFGLHPRQFESAACDWNNV